jgi:uracil-DNA glycosylase
MSKSVPLAELEKQATHLAKTLRLNTDAEIYRSYGKDPWAPLIYGGSLKADIGFFGRDPGRDEIRHWEPLIGSSGKRVRAAVEPYLNGRTPSQGALFSNTVPYKQVGNKAWGTKVIQAFRPIVTELLVAHWKGTHLVTLGNEAFHWFEGAGELRDEDEFTEYWKKEDRYERHLTVEVPSLLSSKRKRITLYPLPHPSPLNATWFKRFPDLLDRQLGTAFRSI